MLRFPALLLLATMALAPLTFAQDVPSKTPRPPKESKTHAKQYTRNKAPISGAVYIGDRAPDFELDASNGRAIKLSQLRGKWVILAFADRWRAVTALGRAERDLEALDGRLVAVCHEKQQTLMGAVARDSIPFLMLADPTGEVSGLYGLFEWQRTQTEPGFFILGPDGTVHIGVLGTLFPADQMVEVVRLAKASLE